jgi:cytochrome c biogenesis protein
VEYTGLRVINVENMGASPGEGGTDVRKVDLRDAMNAQMGAANKTKEQKSLRNVGPSVTYKLRDGAGQAREYHNYMLPVDMGEGVPVFLLGMRETPADAFRYIRVPADEKGTMDDFMRLSQALASPAMREKAVQRYASKAVDGKRPELSAQLRVSAGRALDLFAGVPLGGRTPAVAGLQAISDFIEANVPEAERSKAGEVLVRILNGVLFELELVSREQAGLPVFAGDARGQAFMTQAVLALSDVPLYPAPLVLTLADFTQVQASVFQLARAPGKNVVYLGCALLILGVFAMLYVRERRVWVWLAPGQDGSTSEATMAFSTNRKTLDSDKEFEHLKVRLLAWKE